PPPSVPTYVVATPTWGPGPDARLLHEADPQPRIASAAGSLLDQIARGSLLRLPERAQGGPVAVNLRDTAQQRLQDRARRRHMSVAPVPEQDHRLSRPPDLLEPWDQLCRDVRVVGVLHVDDRGGETRGVNPPHIRPLMRFEDLPCMLSVAGAETCTGESIH